MISMRNQRGIVINALIFAAIIIGYIIVTFFTTSPAPKTLSFEDSSLQAHLTPLNEVASKTSSLKEFRGQNILIHFWASWCKACDADQNAMAQFAKAGSDSAIQVIGIASSDTRDAIEKSGKAKNDSYAQFLDETGNLALALGVKSFPQTILVDGQGRVLAHIQDTLNTERLQGLKLKMSALSKAPGSVPDFALESSLGGLVHLSNLDRRVWVADFIFTSCPMLCPTLTAKMHQLQEEFKDDENFKLVSISVDPETDRPAVLKKYAQIHGADPQKWYFLTGKLDAIKNLLVRGFKLGTPEKPEFHTSRFVLVDAYKRIQGYYDVDSAESFQKLKVDIARLLR